MFYLLLSILGGSLISVILRLSNGKVKSSIAMLFANYVTCVLLAAAFIGFGNVLPRTEGVGHALSLGGINGVLYLTAFVLMEYTTRKDGVVLPAIFSKLGLLVPIALAFFVFGEMPTAFQLAGSVIAVLSILLINYEKGTKFSLNLWLILLLLSDGAGAAMLKVFGETGDTALSDHFILYTFFFAGLLCCLLMLLKKERLGVKEIVFGALIGVPNFMGSRFLMKALEEMPAVIAYPSRSVAVILVVALAGVLLFGERLRKNQWIAVTAILASLVLLNI